MSFYNSVRLVMEFFLFGVRLSKNQHTQRKLLYFVNAEAKIICDKNVRTWDQYFHI
jgi:hypothetical protein